MLFYICIAAVLVIANLIYRAFFRPYPVLKGVPHGEKKKVIVIGAGVSGLATAKEMMDEGHEVILYEKNTTYGGLWNFSATNRSSARVYNKLITNSSAMVMAFSDHPPKAERFDTPERTLHRGYPYHYTADQYKEYVDSYIERFDIKKVWNLGHSVQKITELEGDRWQVMVRNEESKETFTTDCDFVAVATGQHHCPNDLSKTIPGMADFPGQTFHSRNFVSAEIFRGKRVVVIGGGDSAADLVRYCSETSPGNVYHSVRSGAHVIPRYFGEKSTPFDYCITRLSMYMPTMDFLQNRDTVYPKVLNMMAKKGDQVCEQIVRLLDMNGRHEREYFGTKSAMGCEALAEGKAFLKTGLKEMRGTTAIFNKNKAKIAIDDEPLDNVDAVLFCTGYVPRYDFLPTKALAEHPHLERYSLVWHPDLKNVAFIGFARPAGLGAIPPLAEAQARWAAQVLSGKIRLPSADHMRKCCMEMRAKFVKEKPGIKVDSTGHLIVFSYYIAHIYQKLGASPNMANIFFTDQELFWNLMLKAFTPLQFRLNGPHACPEQSRKVINSLTARNKLPYVIRNWRKVSFNLVVAALKNQMGFAGSAAGYHDAYGLWN